VARQRKGAIERKIGAVVLSASIFSAVAWGQENAPPASPLMPAPFSRDCQVGTDTVAGQSTLPNVAEALKQLKRIKILAIGASALAGGRANRGGHIGETRKILQQAIKGLDVVMINRGVSGELAAPAAERIRTEVALNEPDLVLWQVGTNDALAYVALDELESTVVDTVRWLKAHKVDVVLVGLQYIDRMEQDGNYRAVRELLRKIAAAENVMIVRRYEAQRLLAQAEISGGGLFPDEFHRSEAGYVCLSQYVARAITLGIFGSGLRPPQQMPSRRP
jgi:lysophospholipase L1-like esterase